MKGLTMTIDPNCERCANMGKPQMYTVKGELGEYVFNVERARQIANDGRHRAFEVPREMVEQMLSVNEDHVPEHIDHVDPSQPGILAQRWGGVALIDGNHRARRCLRDGFVFRAFMLDLIESRACMVLEAQAQLTPELIARELRGMLRNNPQCEMMTVSFTSDEDEVYSEALVRSYLTPEENAHLTIQVEPEDKERNFTCPICHLTSYNLNDEAQGYCGNCHAFTGEHL
jgi:hypothetical protein